MGYEYWTSDQYLVYDLTAAPEENRTPANRSRPTDPYNAGWPVYPEGSKNTANDNILLLSEKAAAHSMFSDGSDSFGLTSDTLSRLWTCGKGLIAWWWLM